jgi:hypothetical protein
MITEKELIEYRDHAEVFLSEESHAVFNHYGIQAMDTKSYLLLKESMGNVVNEVNFRGRRIATIESSYGILELLEPKSDQNFSKNSVDHVSYVVLDYDEVKDRYKDQAITTFDVGSTHGFKIQPSEDIIIEIRNNDILDSAKDFSP